MRRRDSEKVMAVDYYRTNFGFSIRIDIKNEWQKFQVAYLNSSFRAGARYTAEEVCKWCIDHGITYEIQSDSCIGNILKFPIKKLALFRLKYRMHRYTC